jgi:tetratricopeptide (TPR) repeat protein
MLDIGMVLVLVSDTVWLAIISNGFWIALLSLIIIFFRGQIRSVLSSLVRFNVAGASFELKDKKSTLESNAVLTKILLEALKNRESAKQILSHISPTSIHQLAKFAIKYATEVPEEDRDVDILKNIALSLGQSQVIQSAIKILDILIKQAPEDGDLHRLKAVVLLESGVPANIDESETIWDNLVMKHPKVAVFWYGRSMLKAHLQKYDESLTSLEKSIELGLQKQRPDMLEAVDCKLLREARPEDFAKLRSKLDRILSQESRALIADASAQ